MKDPLGPIRKRIICIADAIHWACVLEATAPKAGNVYPGRPFDTLSYEHFIVAAEITSRELTRFNVSTTQRILSCVEETKRIAGTNVNLGIILLMGPIVESMHANKDVSIVFDSWSVEDGQRINKAIRIAEAGGINRVEPMDVYDTESEVDILAAMKSAADRDRIAKQYAEGFTDLAESIVPVLETCIEECGDVLSGICQAHLRILAADPDSLIARKNGLEVAISVQQRAASIDLLDVDAIDQFDLWLRSDGNQLNPGTTADLIAAALLILLCH